MVVLDSNIIISIMKGDKNLLNFIRNNFNNISTTVINVYEIMRGKYVNNLLEEFFESNYNLSLNIRCSEDCFKHI